MATFVFNTPAKIADFPAGSPKAVELLQIWNWNLIGDTLTGITGDPWNVLNDNNRYYYFNPATDNIPSSAQVIPIQWVAFPNRVLWYFSENGSPNNPFQLSGAQILELADTGKIAGDSQFSNGFPQVPRSACPAIEWSSDRSTWATYGPAGPRGWQDEYCEWSVTRDPGSGKIRSVMFTCENPDYWFTLWQVDPTRVLEIYQQVIDPAVQLADLYLLDTAGQPVVNLLTGQPAYNPLNKWNAGTVRLPGVSGGAMHLTSPPNTLGAEVYLAAAATLFRTVSTYDAQSMVCCSRYGQAFRNSDPHIGFTANQLAKAGFTISLTDPVGLYIQEPDWGVFQTPDGTPAQTFWKVIRGSAPSQILHAIIEVPESYGYTVSDITINGAPVNWAGQIPQAFQMQLSATGFKPTSAQPQNSQPCQLPAPNPTPQAVALLPNNLFIAYNNLYTIGGNITNSPVLPAPIVQQGQTVQLALQCTDVAVNPAISFGEGITVTIDRVDQPFAAISAARNSSPLDTRTFQITVAVSTTAAPGQRGLTLANPRQTTVVAAPSMLTVVPVGWSSQS